MVGAGSARRIASSSASSQRLATDHSGCVWICAHLGAWAVGRTSIATTLPAASTIAAPTANAVLRRTRPAGMGEVDPGVLNVSGYDKHLEERSTNLLRTAGDELGQRSETVRRSNLSAIVRE